MKHVKPSTICGLILLVSVLGLLFYKRVRSTESNLAAPVAGKKAFTGQASQVGVSSAVLGDMEESGVSRTETPVTVSKITDAQIMAASAPHQHVEAEESNALATNSTFDSGHLKIAPDESPASSSKVEEESVQDVKIYIAAARAGLEAKNVPTGERMAKTSIHGDEIIVTFSPKPGERAGDFIVRVDIATGKVIDTTIWR